MNKLNGQFWKAFVAIGLAIFTSKISVTDAKVSAKPNVVFILADDYGFNDIGYHAINHESGMKTPFLDSLAMAGVRLENYYVQPVCTPTRSQLLSGRYQIHTGLQHSYITPLQPHGLPLDNILLPEQLKECGYDTHMIGKWHVGFYKKEYEPWNRGFDTYFGYLTGREDYYTRLHCEDKIYCGYDMDTEKGPTDRSVGEYSAHLFARKAEEIIASHNKTKPMFLYVALQSVHSPLQAPQSYMEPFSYIKDENRRTYAGMVAAMDEAIKNITQHLQSAGMWDNTLFIFSTDNGGQTLEGGNNWPLRGRKATLWEGGVRGVGFVHGKMLNMPNPNVIINDELFHVSDWLPTILSAAECPLIPGTPSLDGFDQWNTIRKYAPSPRSEILHNIDPLYPTPNYHNLKSHGKTIRMGFNTSVRAAIRHKEWKLLTGDPGFDLWVEPPESHNKNIESHVVNNVQLDDPGVQVLNPKLVQLFNIKNDPYEKVEVSDIYPDVVDMLLMRLAKYNATAVPVVFPDIDPKADPKFHGGFWQPWIN